MGKKIFFLHSSTWWIRLPLYCVLPRYKDVFYRVLSPTADLPPVTKAAADAGVEKPVNDFRTFGGEETVGPEGAAPSSADWRRSVLELVEGIVPPAVAYEPAELAILHEVPLRNFQDSGVPHDAADVKNQARILLVPKTALFSGGNAVMPRFVPRLVLLDFSHALPPWHVSEGALAPTRAGAGVSSGSLLPRGLHLVQLSPLAARPWLGKLRRLTGGPPHPKPKTEDEKKKAKEARRARLGGGAAGASAEPESPGDESPGALEEGEPLSPKGASLLEYQYAAPAGRRHPHRRGQDRHAAPASEPAAPEQGAPGGGSGRAASSGPSHAAREHPAGTSGPGTSGASAPPGAYFALESIHLSEEEKGLLDLVPCLYYAPAPETPPATSFLELGTPAGESSSHGDKGPSSGGSGGSSLPSRWKNKGRGPGGVNYAGGSGADALRPPPNPMEETHPVVTEEHGLTEEDERKSTRDLRNIQLVECAMQLDGTGVLVQGKDKWLSFVRRGEEWVMGEDVSDGSGLEPLDPEAAGETGAAGGSAENHWRLVRRADFRGGADKPVMSSLPTAVMEVELDTTGFVVVRDSTAAKAVVVMPFLPQKTIADAGREMKDEEYLRDASRSAVTGLSWYKLLTARAVGAEAARRAANRSSLQQRTASALPDEGADTTSLLARSLPPPNKSAHFGPLFAPHAGTSCFETDVPTR